MSIDFALECLKSDLENALLHASAATLGKDTLDTLKAILNASEAARIARKQSSITETTPRCLS
jgi:hypothetical protein